MPSYSLEFSCTNTYNYKYLKIIKIKCNLIAK